MDFIVVLGVVTVALVVGGGLVMHTLLSDRAKAKRALREAARKTIADVRDGEVVKISGTLGYGPSSLVAPLTGRRCAAWFATVVEEAGRSRREIIRDGAHAPFYVDDGSSRAFVEGEATYVIVVDQHLRQGLFNEPTDEMKVFLTSHGQDSQGVLFNRTLAYTEGVLEEGETVAVLGLAHWEPDPDPVTATEGYRGRAMRLRLSAPPGSQMILSDELSVAD